MLPLALLMIPPAIVLLPFRVIASMVPLALLLESPTAILPPIPVLFPKVILPILALLSALLPFILIFPVIVELFSRVISPMVAVLVLSVSLVASTLAPFPVNEISPVIVP